MIYSSNVFVNNNCVYDKSYRIIMIATIDSLYLIILFFCIYIQFSYNDNFHILGYLFNSNKMKFIPAVFSIFQIYFLFLFFHNILFSNCLNNLSQLICYYSFFLINSILVSFSIFSCIFIFFPFLFFCNKKIQHDDFFIIGVQSNIV